MENVRINQAVCESRESEKVIKFVNENHLTEKIIQEIESGWIWGLYYDESGNVVAEDIWGNLKKDVIK